MREKHLKYLVIYISTQMPCCAKRVRQNIVKIERISPMDLQTEGSGHVARSARHAYARPGSRSRRTQALNLSTLCSKTEFPACHSSMVQPLCSICVCISFASQITLISTGNY